MLSQPEAVDLLLSRGLLDPADLVLDNLTVANVSRRHLNYWVNRENGPGYMLKQGLGKKRAAALAHEADMYARLSREPALANRYLARLHLHDADLDVAIFEWVAGGENLREYHARCGRFPMLPARALADAIGRLHQLHRDGPIEAPGVDRTPWILSIHRPTISFFHECSSANLELIRIVQEFPDFCDRIEALGREWRTEALIHGDLKWDNCIILGKSPKSRKTRLKMVDWELARTGDPAWDVGSVLHDYLAFWLLSIPIAGSGPPENALNFARFKLETMHPAIGAFWKTYLRQRKLAPPASEELLLRAVRYCAARLLQTVFEQVQHSMQLNGNMICILQVSFNILQRPREAAVHLLGIGPREIASHEPA